MNMFHSYHVQTKLRSLCYEKPTNNIYFNNFFSTIKVPIINSFCVRRGGKGRNSLTRFARSLASAYAELGASLLRRGRRYQRLNQVQSCLLSQANQSQGPTNQSQVQCATSIWPSFDNSVPGSSFMLVLPTTSAFYYRNTQMIFF